MSVDNEKVKQVASLACLKVEEDKLESTKREFNGILDWVEQLKEVDTSNVEPLVSVHEGELFCRSDEVTDGHLKNEVLQNAPVQEFGYFVVPKFVR